MMMGQAKCQLHQLEPSDLFPVHVCQDVFGLKQLIIVSTAHERRFGLKRLGTIMNRSRQNPKPLDRPASPEKRSRPNFNPLRRGTNTRDMQTIPSPQGSMTNLPSPPLPPQPRIVSTDSEPQPLQESRRKSLQQNGETLQPPPVRTSSLPGANGAQPIAVPMTSQEQLSTVSQAKPAEVCRSTLVS